MAMNMLHYIIRLQESLKWEHFTESRNLDQPQDKLGLQSQFDY